MNNKFQKAILQKVKPQVLGNSDRSLKHLASDLLNQTNNDKWVAENAYLNIETVKRLRDLKEAKSGADYQPKLDTVERVLRALGCRLTGEHVSIRGAYAPKPKE